MSEPGQFKPEDFIELEESLNRKISLKNSDRYRIFKDEITYSGIFAIRTVIVIEIGVVHFLEQLIDLKSAKRSYLSTVYVERHTIKQLAKELGS
jgi:hypothetical protein